MRVFGLNLQDPVQNSLGGTATYTRRPANVQMAYADVAPKVHAPQSVPTTHEVKTGENLTRIVHDHLSATGTQPSHADVFAGVRAVARDNRLANPDLIHPGQVLDLSVLQGGTAKPVPVATSTEPLPQLELPVARAVQGTPVPRRTVEITATLDDPDGASVDGTVEKKVAVAPVDRLLQEGGGAPSGEPLRIATSSVAALMSPPASQDGATDEVHGRSGPTGGSGPVPSEAAIALQRILNKTSNAIHALRGLVDGDGARPAEPQGPWVSLIQGKARLSSEFGTRRDPFTGRVEFHDGIDLAVKRGTGITAVRDGEVVHAGWKGGYGNTVVLRHEDGVETLYAHASKLVVQTGDKVTAGTHIADVGSSGRSTGPHLHFEVREHGRAVNPMPYVEASPDYLAEAMP